MLVQVNLPFGKPGPGLSARMARRSVAIPCALVICALFIVTSPWPAAAQQGDSGPFQAVNDLRLNGEYDKAVAVLRETLAGLAPDAVLRRAYSELVFTLLQMDMRPEAEAVVTVGLQRFPDLTADIVLFPASVNELYDLYRERLFGSVAVRTNPSECVVWIDGVARSEVPLTQKYLLAGKHELTVRKEEHNEVSLSFAIEPNQETLIDITLQRQGKFRTRGRFRPGFDIGLNSAGLDYAGASTPGASVTDGDGKVQATYGVFTEVGINPRLYLWPGLRVVRLGNTTNYQTPSFLPAFTTSAKADVRLDYLSTSLFLKHFPFDSQGLFVSGGPEVAWLLSAKLSPFDLEPRSQFDLTQMDPSIDISDNLKSYNVSVNGGVGYEFPAGDNFVFVNLQYSHGLVNTAKDDGSDLGWRSRELKVSAGFVY